MNKIQLIEEAIDLAKQEKSQLTQEILELPSFSSAKIKHLLNNLGSISNYYLEVGIHKAGTFIAANYKNKMVANGFDDYSEFEQNGLSRKLAYEYCQKYLTNFYKIEEIDFFKYSWAASKPEGIYDFYLYDGNHADWAQKKGLTHVKGLMQDEFIFCVDDSSWPSVKKGTQEGLKELNYKILFEQHLFDGKEGGEWHNGFSVYLLKK